jgi:hypothetical protein
LRTEPPERESSETRVSVGRLDDCLPDIARPSSRAIAYGMMYGMRRTTIYLPDELKAALERTASAQGTSEAEVIRSALFAAIREQAYPEPRLPLFDSGDPTLAERVDEALAAGFGE